MPGIGNCNDSAMILVALRYYHAKLPVGEWLLINPDPPNPYGYKKKGFPFKQWQHACRAARRIADVSCQAPMYKRYGIRKPVWDEVRNNLVAIKRFHAGRFDTWILSAKAERDFLALPLFWRVDEARAMLGEHADQFLVRTRAYWESATGDLMTNHMMRPPLTPTCSPERVHHSLEPARDSLRARLGPLFRRLAE